MRVFVRLCVAQTLGKRLQQGPGHLGMLFDERFELPDSEAVAEEIRRRLAEIDRGQSVPLSLDEFERRVTERSWRFESGPMLPLPTKSATHIDGIVVRAYCKPVGF